MRVEDSTLTKRRQTSKVTQVAISILKLVILAFVLFTIYMIPRMSFFTTEVAEYYSSHIFPIVASCSNFYNALFMTSLTELAVIVLFVLGIALVILFIIGVVKSIKNRNLLKYLYRVVTAILVIAIVLGTVFQLMHGINYRRESVVSRLGIESSKRSTQEIAEVNMWAYIMMLQARMELNEDHNGIAQSPTSFNDLVIDCNELINVANEEINLGLDDNIIQCKPVSLSKYWYYTGIVGMYNPFLGEVSINVYNDSVCDFPLIVLHEMCHAKGYAREDDCELLSLILGIASARPDVRYAAYLAIYEETELELLNLDYKVDYSMWNLDTSGLSRDRILYRAYMNELHPTRITEIVGDISTTTNDIFLKSNDQDEGVMSYVIDSSNIVEFYYKYVKVSEKT